MIDINFNSTPSSEHRFYLCKPTPNRQTVAEITPKVTEISITESFGYVNELSITIPFQITNENGESIRNPVIDKGAYGGYLVKYEFQGIVKDYYIITDIQQESGDDGSKRLLLTCYQLQYEWKDKVIRSFKGTYQLYDPVGNDGLLNLTLIDKTNGTWTVDYIDGSLINGTKYRTFDTSEQDMLNFIIESIQKYGNYVPVFDTINRTISIYLMENSGVDEGIHLEYGNYLKSVTGLEQSNEIATRVYVYGNNVTIRSLNPTGTDYVESLEYFMLGYQEDGNGNVISHSPFMSDALVKAERNYQALLVAKTPEFNNLLDQKGTQEEILTTKQNELFSLETQMSVLQDEKDVLIGTSSDLANINQRIAAKQQEIDQKENEITSVENQIENIDNHIAQLREEIAIGNNFTVDLLQERNYFVKERVWQDNTYTKAEDLYEQAKNILAQWAQPTYVYECSVADILNQLNIPHDRERLKIGSIITLYYPEFDIDVKMSIIQLSHDIVNNDLNLILANTLSLKTGFLKYTDLIRKSAYSSTQIDQNKFNWDQAETANSSIQDYINGKIDANKQAIESGDTLQYMLDTRGLTIKNPLDPMKYLRAVNSVLAITNDGGNTWKNAITYDGVIAEQVIGQLGAFVKLYADSIVTNPDGTGIQDGLIQSSPYWNSIQSIAETYTDGKDSALRGDLRLTAPLPTSIALDANGITAFTQNNPSAFARLDYRGLYIQNGAVQISSASGTTMLTSTGINATAINAGSLTGITMRIGSGNNVFNANTSGISLGNASFSAAPFRVNMQGQLVASQATITGQINATSGTFSGNISVTGSITGGSFNGPNISNGAIVGTSINVNNKFTVDSQGNMTCRDATFRGDIESSDIDGGTITGARIVGGSIESNTSIEVTTDLYVGNDIYLQGSGDKRIFFASGLGWIQFDDSSDSIAINAWNDIELNSLVGGSILVNGEEIATQSWVLSNAIAKFS